MVKAKQSRTLTQTKGKGVRIERRYSLFEVFMEISKIFGERL
jgi:hypothetical protein